MPGFSLYTEDESLKVYLPFGLKEPKKIGGGPVLARVNLPEGKSLTEWVRREPTQIQISYRLVDWEDRRGQEFEKKIRMIERMMGEDEGDPEPPKLIVMGDPPGSVPKDFHDASHLRWWLEDHTEADGTERNSSGNRIDVSGTITLCEVVTDRVMAKALGNAKSRPKRPRKYTVKRGDTLSKIAARYKIKGGWQTLAKLNNLRDPRRIREGQVIRLS
jgi:nucleoid-associated protein YgaU